jgi:hypothetical protein
MGALASRRKSSKSQVHLVFGLPGKWQPTNMQYPFGQGALIPTWMEEQNWQKNQIFEAMRSSVCGEPLCPAQLVLTALAVVGLAVRAVSS